MSEVLTTFDNVAVEDKEQKDKIAKLNKLNIFSKQVIERLIKNKIPPTPANFAVYFEKLLDEKPISQKEDIEDILKLENRKDVEAEYLTKIDIFIKDNFENTKKLLENVSKLYLRMMKLKSFIKKQGLELSNNPSKQKVLSFEKKVNSAIETLEKQQDIIKENYLHITTLMKKFNKESIFDKKYGVFNKKYILEEIKKELQSMLHFNYKSTLVAFKVSDEILKKVKLQSDREIIIKTVVNTIHERSRRSDILAHYEDNIFLFLLKHTDLEQAKRAMDSIKSLISFSNFIIDSKQIFAKIDTNLVEFNIDKNDIDEIVGEAISGVLN